MQSYMFRHFYCVGFEKIVKLCYNNSRYVKRQSKRKFMTQSQWSKGYIIAQDCKAAQKKEELI